MRFHGNSQQPMVQVLWNAMPDVEEYNDCVETHYLLQIKWNENNESKNNKSKWDNNKT